MSGTEILIPTQPRRPIHRDFVSIALLACVCILFLPSFVLPIFSHASNYAITELLINYQAGFVRRGFLGQAALMFYNATGCVPLKAFAAGFFLAISTLAVSLILLLRAYRKNFPGVAICLLFSPGLLMFYAYDIEAYFRKETLLLAVFALHAIAARALHTGRLKRGQYRTFLAAFILPAICLGMLIHEVQLFLLPAHLCIAAFALRADAMRLRWLIALSVIPLMVAVAPITHPGNPAASAIILASVKPFVPPDFSGAIESLGWPIKQSMHLSLQVLRSPIATALYAVTFLFTVGVPAILLLPIVLPSNTCGAGKRPILIASVIVILAPTPLYALGGDFGRWISMTGVSLTFFLLSFPIDPTSVPARVAGIHANRWTWLVVAYYLLCWTQPPLGVHPDVFASGLGHALVQEREVGQTIQTHLPTGRGS